MLFSYIHRSRGRLESFTNSSFTPDPSISTNHTSQDPPRLPTTQQAHHIRDFLRLSDRGSTSKGSTPARKLVQELLHVAVDSVGSGQTNHNGICIRPGHELEFGILTVESVSPAADERFTGGLGDAVESLSRNRMVSFWKQKLRR